MQSEVLPPVIVSFAITRECNLRCKHCYSNSKDSPHPQELNTEETKRVITEIAETGTRLLVFDGGEPLMRPDIYELIAHAKKAGLYPVLSTNATLLSSEAVDKLKRAGIRALAISIQGADAKTHDDFCGIEGSWERAMAGTHNAATAGLLFQINTCLSHHNLDQFDDIAKLAEDTGAVALEVFNFAPVGKGKEHSQLALTSQEQHSFVTHLIQLQLNNARITYRCVALPQLFIEVEKTILEEEKKERFDRTCCSAGVHYCYILYDGTVYPCMMLQKKAGNVREKSFQEIWQRSEMFKLLRNRDKLEGRCKHCDYRQLCGGARCLVFEETGSLTKEDGYCWFTKEELKRPILLQEAGCAYCEGQPIAVCKVCGAPLCRAHSITCPLCQASLCHPDVKDCFFKHNC